MVKLTECPRDAMQGIRSFISTEDKMRYLTSLLDVGFDILDCGSFVSHKAIPQMADTHQVIQLLGEMDLNTELLTIVANLRGAKDAMLYDHIKYVGFPFSISETFQLRNTNSTIEESLERVQEIQELCTKHGKTMLVYISMGFGNPYGDPWNVELVMRWVDKLVGMGIKIFALSDTIGVANASSIKYIFKHLIPSYSDVEFAAHLHTTPDTWFAKVDAAYLSGCHRFDGAIKGYGGCPMAKDDLTGNMPTENLVEYFLKKDELPPTFSTDAFKLALEESSSIFPAHL